MPSHRFSIDCREEEAHFRRMLAIECRERIMAIKAKGESGKSHFLQRCERVCREADPPVPSARVDFAELDDGEPVELVRAIRRRFRRAIDFARFDELLRDLDMGVWKPPAAVAGVVDTRDASFEHAHDFVVAGVAVNNPQGPVTVTAAAPIGLSTDQALRAAREECVNAFFDALATHCEQHSAAIILDTFEQSAEQVAGWLELEMRERLDTGDWPERLIVVVAGQSIPPFREEWQGYHFEERVVVVDPFGQWKPQDIEDGFRELGFEEPPPEIFEAVVTFLDRGATPGQLIGLMQLAGDPATGRGG